MPERARTSHAGRALRRPTILDRRFCESQLLQMMGKIPNRQRLTLCDHPVDDPGLELDDPRRSLAGAGRDVRGEYPGSSVES